MLSLDEYLQRYEALQVALNHETFQQAAGLPHDETRMQALAGDIETAARALLEAFPRETLPRPLFWDLLEAGRASDYTRLRNQIHRLRSEAVSTTVDGEAVNLSNWRQYVQAHLREADRRRRVLDGLMEAADALTPALEERFRLSRGLYGAHGATPLDIYLEDEQVTLERLETLVTSAARAAGPAFREAGDRYARETLGKPLEYYDDLYVFMGAIGGPLNQYYAGIDFDRQINGVYRALGFDLSRISIDGEPRPGKHVSPSCWGIHIPTDVRVIYQRTSPSSDYEGYCHEMGHALHFASVNPGRSYVERNLIPGGTAEIFSTLFETLGSEPRFLAEDLGFPRTAIDEITSRGRFMEYYFLVFYGANALLKIRFWREGLSVADSDEVYAHLYADLVGLPMPGRYWQTHHVAGMYDVYAPSYLLAKVRMEELKQRLRAGYGETWWRDPRAGAHLRDELMGPGRTIDLNAFSRLDERPYLRSIGL